MQLGIIHKSRAYSTDKIIINTDSSWNIFRTRSQNTNNVTFKLFYNREQPMWLRLIQYHLNFKFNQFFWGSMHCYEKKWKWNFALVRCRNVYFNSPIICLTCKPWCYTILIRKQWLINWMEELMCCQKSILIQIDDSELKSFESLDLHRMTLFLDDSIIIRYCFSCFCFSNSSLDIQLTMFTNYLLIVRTTIRGMIESNSFELQFQK